MTRTYSRLSIIDIKLILPKKANRKLMRTLYPKPLSAILVTVLSLTACHKSVDPTPVYPDERGRLVAELTPLFYELLGWSADGRELYYFNQIQYTTADMGNSRLYALNVQTGTSRLIYDGPNGQNLTKDGVRGYCQSPDGRYLYMNARGRKQAGYSVYRVNPQAVNQAMAIDSSLDQQYPTNPYTPELVVSADGNWLSYRHRPDSIRLHNLVNGSVLRFSATNTGVVAFAPEGSQVLFSGINFLYRSLTLPGLSERIIDMKLPADSSRYREPYVYSSYAWHPAGIRYIYTEPYFDKTTNKFRLKVFLRDATKQKSTLLWLLPEEEQVFWGDAVWSRQGDRIAFTTTNSQQALAGSKNAILYTTDLLTLKTSKVAAITIWDEARAGIRTVGTLFLSPDQTSLAYTIGNKVYISSIQP